MDDKKYIVTVVDYGESCDGKARVLEVCNTRDEAKSFVQNDIEEACDRYAGCDIVCDFDKMEIRTQKDDDLVSAWNIEEINKSKLS